MGRGRGTVGEEKDPVFVEEAGPEGGVVIVPQTERIKEPEEFYSYRKLYEEVKERVPLEEYAASLTDLESFGRDWWTGRCPLPDHEDKEPSFYVYPDGRGHCYGCGFHGDVIDLHQRVENISSSWAAVVELALKHGIRVDTRTEKWRGAQRRKVKVLNCAEEVVKQSFRRRAFKVAVLPKFRDIEDPDERRSEIGLAWKDWQRELRRCGL